MQSAADTEPRPLATVLLFRHAEKPADRSDPHLSAEGRRRAERLAHWLPRAVPGIGAVFAASASPRSNRPAETVEPLARALGLTVDARFGDGRHEDLARLLLGAAPAATVLVCWRHGTLPDLARDLGARGVPARWEEGEYDLFWRLDYGRDGVSDLRSSSQAQEELRSRAARRGA